MFAAALKPLGLTPAWAEAISVLDERERTEAGANDLHTKVKKTSIQAFPPMLLAPVNFDGLYMQHMQKLQEEGQMGNTAAFHNKTLN